MKFTQWHKASFTLLILLLALLVVAGSATGWYALQQNGLEIGAATGAATLESVRQRTEFASHALLAVAILAVAFAVLALLALSRALWRPLGQARQVFERIAAGDLTQRIDGAAQHEIGHLYAIMKRLQDSLGRNVGSVRAGMELIGAGAHQIVSGNNDLSSRTEQQAAALQQTAASMEQLASTVKQNADNARQANQLAVTASEVAQRGGQAVGEVVSTMQDISASSRKISDIVGVIDSIAFQTNILALNAAVEAARAGEQGKGFAVVASEVRALAQRSAHAAKEIKDLIDDSVKKVAEGSEQVERAGSTMEEIVTSVARVTDIMGEISAATTEQASGIDQVNLAVAQMDGVTQQNAILVQEAAKSAEQFRNHVSYVNQAVSGFKLGDHQVIDVAAVALPARVVAVEQSSSRPAPAIAGVRTEAVVNASRRALADASASPTPARAPSPPQTSYVRPASTQASAEGDWEEF